MLSVTMATLFFTVSLSARSASESISGLKSEDAKETVESTLQKLDSSYTEVDNTDGFAYRLRSKPFSPFMYNIYISPYKSGTMIHVESPSRMADGMIDIILQENKAGPFENSYKSKSHLLGFALTWISPSLGTVYANTQTPFAKNNLAAHAFAYLGVDAVLLGLGGSGFFKHKFDPTGEGLTETLILLGIHRLVHSYPVHMKIAAQNKAVELGFSFRY